MFSKIKTFIKNNYILFYCLYFSTLFLEVTTLPIDYLFISKPIKLLRYIAYLMFFIRIILVLPEMEEDIKNNSWKKKDKVEKIAWFMIGIIFVSIIINLMITSNRSLLFLLFVLVASYGVDYKKIFKVMMYTQIVISLITIGMSAVGLTQNYILYRGGRAKNSMGFTYPAVFAQVVLCTTILYLYAYHNKMKIWQWILLQVVNIFTYCLTLSRTEFAFVEITLIAVAIIKFSKLNFTKIKIKYTKIFTKFVMILPVISLFCVLCYPLGGPFEKLNDILSSRLELPYEDFKKYGVTAFGTDVELVGYGLTTINQYGDALYSNYNFIDNGYLQTMFKYGFVFEIVLIALINMILIMLYRRKKYKEIILLSVFLIFELINGRLLSLRYCPMLFIIIPTLVEYGKTKIKEERNNNEEIDNEKLHI